MFNRNILVIALLFISLATASANYWPQQGFNWRQQNEAPFAGPSDFTNPTFVAISTSPISFGPITNKEGIVFAGVNNLIAAYNESTNALLWQIAPHVRYSGYNFFGAAVTKSGSLVVAIGAGSYIDSFLTVNSQGKFDSQIEFNTITTATKFFLGPKDEIIVSTSYTPYRWTIAKTNQNESFEGLPWACEDSGNVFVSNSTFIWKTSLSNPDIVFWYFKISSAGITVSSFVDAAIASNEESVLFLSSVYSSTFYLLSIDILTGSLDWIFYGQKVSSAGQLAISKKYIFISYQSSGYSTWSQFTLNNEGYLLNSIPQKFTGPAMIVDSDSIVYSPAYATSTYYLNVCARNPNGEIISTAQYYTSSCYNYAYTNLIFTNTTSMWLSSSCSSLGLVHLTTKPIF